MTFESLGLKVAIPSSRAAFARKVLGHDDPLAIDLHEVEVVDHDAVKQPQLHLGHGHFVRKHINHQDVVVA